MKAFSKLAVAALITFTSAATAFAQDGHGAHGAAAGHAHAHAGQHAAVAVQMVDGEIKKVDKEAGKVTIRHGEIKNLGMPAMTMVFRVKDNAMLDQVKAGDKVKFVAEKVNGAFTVVQLQNVK